MTLIKADWLDRRATGALTYSTFRLEKFHLRTSDAAVVTANQLAEGTYQGHPLPRHLRVRLALARQTGPWRLTVVHMSFVTSTPGARRFPPAAPPPTRRVKLDMTKRLDIRTEALTSSPYDDPQSGAASRSSVPGRGAVREFVSRAAVIHSPRMAARA